MLRAWCWSPGTTVLLAQAPPPLTRAGTGAGGASGALSGVSTARLARIDAMLQTYVDQGLIPGAVALVL